MLLVNSSLRAARLDGAIHVDIDRLESHCFPVVSVPSDCGRSEAKDDFYGADPIMPKVAVVIASGFKA